MAPSHPVAGIRCHRAAIVLEPCVQIGFIARAIALNRSVCCRHINGWSSRVFNRERGRCAAAKTARICSREGHHCRARRAAIVAEGIEVMAPSHPVAGIRCHRAAIVLEPCVQIGFIARAIALNRSVCCRHVNGWGCRVFNRERSRRAAAIATIVVSREGHCYKSCCATIATQISEVVTPSHTVTGIGCHRTAVALKPCVQFCFIASAVAFNRQICSHCIDAWRSGVNDRDGLNMFGCIACAVGGRPRADERIGSGARLIGHLLNH